MRPSLTSSLWNSFAGPLGSSFGHPLVGDTVYAGKRERYGMDGQALHASDLIFSHPITGEKIHVHAELPPVMEDLIGRLRR